MKYFVLASLLCLSACGDDNDNKNNETPQNLAELTVEPVKSVSHRGIPEP